MNHSHSLREICSRWSFLNVAASAPPQMVGDPGHQGFSLWSPGRVENAFLDTKYGGKNLMNSNCPS